MKSACQLTTIPLLERLQSARGGFLAAAIALALSAPALAAGFSTDDHLAAYKVHHGVREWSQFTLLPPEIATGIANGTFAWWTSPNLFVRFLRPLATLSHRIEFSLWPHSAWAMHLLNALLYAVLVATAWRLYRELTPRQPHVAALAALMFAVDEGHAVSVGWISGRNTLLASMFALMAFRLHLRARITRRRVLMLASAACTMLALASAEAGLAGLGYFIAYALVFEPGSLRRRAATLAPQLLAIACWASIYISAGFGVRGASLYRDLSEPLVALTQGVLDLPVWLVSLLGPTGSTLVLLLPENLVRLGALLICLPLLAALVGVVPRTRENAFFALGALLCLPPLFTTLPQERLLMLASFGAFGLLAGFIDVAASHAQRFVRGMRWVLIGVHIVLAPLWFIPSLNQTLPIEHAAQALADAVPAGPLKQVIVVNAPLDVLSLHASMLMAQDSARARPESMHVLYAGASQLAARRIDAQTLELVADEGWGKLVIERIFSTLATMPRVGSELALESMRVLVRGSMPDGRPQHVQFRFPSPLEAPDRLWLIWQGHKPVPWKPPAIGETVTLSPRYLFNSLEL